MDGFKSFVRAIHELPLRYQLGQSELFLPQNVSEIVEERNALSEMEDEKENQIKAVMDEMRKQA